MNARQKPKPFTPLTHSLTFQAEGPKPEKIPHDDVIGVTVVLITCSYLGREFIRIGYYVNNEYDDPELTENPPSTHDFNRIFRNILADKPRVTKFRIPWQKNTTETKGRDLLFKFNQLSIYSRDNEPTAQEEAAMAMEAQKAMQMEAAATGAGMGLNMQLQQSSSTDMAMEQL